MDDSIIQIEAEALEYIGFDYAAVRVTSSVEAEKEETRTALQTVYDSMNKGQRKQMVKNEKVKVLFDLYGVNYEE